MTAATWSAEALFGPQRSPTWGCTEPDSFYDLPVEPRVIVQRRRVRGELRGRLVLLSRDGVRAELGGQRVTFDEPPCVGSRFLVRVSSGKPYELARVTEVLSASAERVEFCTARSRYRLDLGE